jgi:hypothetical protein
MVDSKQLKINSNMWWWFLAYFSKNKCRLWRSPCCLVSLCSPSHFVVIMKLPPKLWSDLTTENNFKSCVCSLLAFLKEKSRRMRSQYCPCVYLHLNFQASWPLLWNYDSVTDVNLWAIGVILTPLNTETKILHGLWKYVIFTSLSFFLECKAIKWCRMESVFCPWFNMNN